MAEIFDLGLQQHTIKMDERFFNKTLLAVAGDTARRLTVQLLDSNNMVQDTTGLQLRLNAIVAGQATYTDAELIDAAKGIYRVDLSNGMLLAPGSWQFQWQVMDSEGKKLNSFPFTGTIGANLAEGATQATNFYLNLDQLKQMQDDFINGAFDSAALTTNIAEKLTDLETQYAPQLQNVTAQLAQKANESDVALLSNFPLLRNIHVSIEEPDESIGNNGDVWLRVLPSNPYYYLGEFEESWVEGLSNGAGSVTKEKDYLKVEAIFEGAIALKTCVTDNAVDLTNINTIYVEWENDGGTNGENTTVQTKFNVSKNKTGDQTVYDARISQSDGIFNKQISTVNVSDLSGTYYLRAHARATGTGQTAGTSTLKVYRVWGE